MERKLTPTEKITFNEPDFWLDLMYEKEHVRHARERTL